MVRKFLSIGLLLSLVITLGSAANTGNFSGIDIETGNNSYLEVDSVYYRNNSFVAQASIVEGNDSVSKAASFSSDGEVSWIKSIEKKDESLIKFGNVFEEENLGIVYNESLDVYNSSGEVVQSLEMRNPDTTGPLLKAAKEDSITYVGKTLFDEESKNFRFKITKYSNKSPVWNKTLSAGGNVDTAYYPRITDIEILQNGSALVSAEGPIPDQGRETEPQGNPTTPDMDWQVFMLSSEGDLNWRKNTSSMKGPDRPLDVSIKDGKAEVIGTYPEDQRLRKKVYALKDGSRGSEESITLSGAENIQRGLISHDRYTGTETADDIIRRYSFPEEVKKAEVNREKLVKEIKTDTSYLNNSEASISRLTAVKAGSETFILANIRSSDEERKTSVIAEVDMRTVEDSGLIEDIISSLQDLIGDINF